jgi:hypothetical protein
MPAVQPLLERTRALVDAFTHDGSYLVTTDGDQSSLWNAGVELRSPKFVITIMRDRDQEWITVGTTIRRKPRSPLAWWPLGHIVGYLDGRPDPYGLVGLDMEMNWLIERRYQILDVSLINSEDLRKWAARASRKLFGQQPRGEAY